MKPIVRLLGEDGNALSILGKTIRALTDAGVPMETVQEYKNEAMSGDYDHLLRVTMEYVEVV